MSERRYGDSTHAGGCVADCIGEDEDWEGEFEKLSMMLGAWAMRLSPMAFLRRGCPPHHLLPRLAAFL